MCMHHMLHADTLLGPEPTSASASVPKLAVATVRCGLCSRLDCNFFLSCTQTMQFFIKPRGQLCIISPILPPIIPFLPIFSGIILDSLANLFFFETQ